MIFFLSLQHLGPFPCSGVRWTLLWESLGKEWLQTELIAQRERLDAMTSWCWFRCRFQWLWELGIPGILEDWGHADAHLDQVSPKFTDTAFRQKVSRALRELCLCLLVLGSLVHFPLYSMYCLTNIKAKGLCYKEGYQAERIPSSC